MTLRIVEEQIERFLAQNDPQIVTIKGKWGSGKTYAWKKMLRKARDEKLIALKNYSYVSLFGISSLDNFKYTIFENTISTEIIENEATMKNVGSYTIDHLNSLARKNSTFLKGLPFVRDFLPPLDVISFSTISKQIICVDDLERKGDNLNIKDILGLLSFLKEERNCKVVILLNDQEAGLGEYFKYQEKVVDIELLFDLTEYECADIAFDHKNLYFEVVKKYCVSLEIKNIRILKKIERFVNLGHFFIDDSEAEVKNKFIKSIVLFSWSYFSQSHVDVPPLSFFANQQFSIYFNNKNATEQEKNWLLTIQKYGHDQTTEFDMILSDAVKKGYFDEPRLSEKILQENESVKLEKSLGSFKEAWRLYHNSFDDNQDEVLSKIYTTFINNCKFLGLGDLDGTVRLFKDFNLDDVASEIISYYIENKANDADSFNIDDYPFPIEDEEVKNRIRLAREQVRPVKHFVDVLKNISLKNGWHTDDEFVLANGSVEEYRHFFKSIHSSRLNSYISTCLQFGNFDSASEQQLLISEKAAAALRMIAAESEINRVRMRKFGIQL